MDNIEFTGSLWLLSFLVDGFLKDLLGDVPMESFVGDIIEVILTSADERAFMAATVLKNMSKLTAQVFNYDNMKKALDYGVDAPGDSIVACVVFVAVRRFVAAHVSDWMPGLFREVAGRMKFDGKCVTRKQATAFPLFAREAFEQMVDYMFIKDKFDSYSIHAVLGYLASLNDNELSDIVDRLNLPSRIIKNYDTFVRNVDGPININGFVPALVSLITSRPKLSAKSVRDNPMWDLFLVQIVRANETVQSAEDDSESLSEKCV